MVRVWNRGEEGCWECEVSWCSAAISFPDISDIEKHMPGFLKVSAALVYSCHDNNLSQNCLGVCSNKLMVTNFILLRPLWTGSGSTKYPLGSLQTSLHLMVKPRTKYDHILYLLASFCMMVCRSVCSAGVCCGCGAEDAWSVENFGAKRLGAKWNLLVSILGAYSDNIYYPFSPSSCTAHLHTCLVSTQPWLAIPTASLLMLLTLLWPILHHQDQLTPSPQKVGLCIMGIN